MYGISELQEVYSLWKSQKTNTKEHFAVSFSAQNRHEALVFVGLESLMKYKGKKIFSDNEVAYLHSLQKDSGKLLFCDKFIRFISTLSYDIEMEAPLEGSIFFPSQPVVKVSGDKLVLLFFKKIITHYLPRQIYIGTEVETIVSLISPGYVVTENSESSFKKESILDSRSGYIAGASATEDLSAAVNYNIPICYHDDTSNLHILNIDDSGFTKNLVKIDIDENVFIKGNITKEFLQEFTQYGPKLKGVLLNLAILKDDKITPRFHYYRNTEILNPEFRIFRISHKGLFIGDLIAGSDEIEKKHTFFGKYDSQVTKTDILVNVRDYKDEPIDSKRKRLIRNMRGLPCKYRSAHSKMRYPVKLLRKNQKVDSEESFSNTRFA